MSHPQALAQCHTFLQAELYGVEREVTPSTAYAAKWVSNNPTELVAAIAPRMAANEYGLEIVKENAQDLELNQTRFFVLSRKPVSILLPKEEEKRLFLLFCLTICQVRYIKSYLRLLGGILI